ncbi:hypothetical protein N7493_001589 [Penicillium malachiteum]|uniref:GPI inositol-deacylase winged helix domain-containing protein n=1 Tax=Penicillium malachiteum TaxID=1324776 RepID=A0AAD6HUF2_9EURO|nr:hypothetical protein N7493_001589 [Penicillium malachiteum]
MGITAWIIGPLRNTSLNLFATSRDVDKITSQFSECTWKEITAQNNDILCYVNSQMSRLCPSQISKYPEVQNLIRHTIVDVARGILPCGPSRLDDTYLQAVERIENQSKGYRELARRTLSWLTYSKRALSLPEIQHALAVRTGAKDLDEKFIADAITLASICAGLIIVDQRSESIDFIHYTTKEYFESTGELEGAKIQISTTCITYLSLKVFNDGSCSSDNLFESRVCKNPFYDYAARNWGHHAGDISGEPGSLILEFLSSEGKLTSSCQAMMVDGSFYHFFNYSQNVPRQIAGVQLAAQFGLLKVMIKLVFEGHDPDLKTSEGRTPLSLAAENGHVALVWLLLTMHQMNTDSKDNNGRTPFSWATVNGHEDSMILFLTNDKVNPDSRDNLGRTPLSLAAQNGHVNALWLLLGDNRVEPDSGNNHGRTPLS